MFHPKSIISQRKFNPPNICNTLLTFTGFAQTKNVEQPEKITKYVTNFPNGEEAITILESSKSDNLKLSSAENFYKYEIKMKSQSLKIFKLSRMKVNGLGWRILKRFAER